MRSSRRTFENALLRAEKRYAKNARARGGNVASDLVSRAQRVGLPESIAFLATVVYRRRGYDAACEFMDLVWSDQNRLTVEVES